MLKRLLVPALFGLLVIPFTFAHPIPPTPLDTPCAPSHDHHYTTGTSLVFGTPITSATWRTTVILADSCPTLDGDGDFGVGGGFLPANHHDAYKGVCVSDTTGFTQTFWIGTVNPSGAVTSISPLFQGCGAAYDTSGVPMPPGADGGWWVFLANEVQTTGQSTYLAAPTTGHICSAPFFLC